MRTKVINRQVGYTTPGRARKYYGNDSIRTSKVVTTPRKVKTVTYGPKTNYGTQTKRKTITRY